MIHPESTDPILNISLSRRQLLWGALGTAALQLLPPNIGHAQEASREATLAVARRLSRRTPIDAANFFSPVTENELVVTLAEVDVSTDEQVNSLGYYSKKEDLGDRILRYTYPSGISARPNIIITESGKTVLFKRRLVRGLNLKTGRRNLSLENINDNYDFPNGYTSPPDFFKDPEPRFWNTEIHSNFGVAIVVNQTIGEIGEVQLFNPTNVAGYIERWGKGDYSKITPPVPSSRSLLITVAGLGSSSDDDTFSNFKGVLPQDKIIPFSYSGEEIYQQEDTFQDISESADRLTNMLRLHRPNFDSIGLLGHSLGGVVIWESLSHSFHEGLVDEFALLDAPINGVPKAELSFFFSYISGDNFLLGNKATNMLSTWASTPDIQKRTKGLNIDLARKLRDEAKIRGMLLISSDDCFTQVNSTTLGLPEMEQILSLGRGAYGIPNCNLITLAPILPGRDAANIGHTQVLTDPRAISQVGAFFKG